METIGTKIKKSRQNMSLSQGELATKIGVKSSAVISNWENDINKPDADKIVLLCKNLNISVSYLLGYYGNGSVYLHPNEQEILEKYFKLDVYGKNAVNAVIEEELKRCADMSVCAKNKKM